jgi:hypothetical protein
LKAFVESNKLNGACGLATYSPKITVRSHEYPSTEAPSHEISHINERERGDLNMGKKLSGWCFVELFCEEKKRKIC